MITLVRKKIGEGSDKGRVEMVRLKAIVKVKFLWVTRKTARSPA